MAIDIANASSDMFLPLKAVVGALSVLIKNYDQTADNTDRIKEIEERVDSLGGILASPVGDQDDEEKARRGALRKKLDDMIAKLRLLSEKNKFVKFAKNASHAKTLNSVVQDLATAVTDYQTSIQQGTYENVKKFGEDTRNVYENTKTIGEDTRNVYENTKAIGEDAKNIYRETRRIGEDVQDLIGATELQLLGQLDPVHDAGYQGGHHDTCLPGTRQSVLDWMMQWAENPQDRHVFWLNGLAGTGKSTLAQTFSGMVAQAGTLGASFFCSRDYLNRKEIKNIFPTLAYQLACRYPAFRNEILRVIKRDPSVARNSLILQLKDLIVDPLSSTNISCIIVVDALDECVDNQPASAILSVLGRYVNNLPSVKFFITGRPESRIRTGFRLPLLNPITQIFLLHEVESSDVYNDIRLYLQKKLTAVAKQRSDLDVSDPWPCDQDLMTLTKKSSGLFIFASTLARFIESEHHEPNERLQLIVTQPDNTAYEGVAGIDPLYTQILELAFSGIKDTEVFKNLGRVLGTVILAFNPLSREQIAKILGINVSRIKVILKHLHSVLLVPDEDHKKIRVFHKSFPDFLQDPKRCSNPKFLIDTSTHHRNMAFGCLELLKKLKPNPCNLPNFVMNRDVRGLPELLEDKVGGGTRYACGYWAMHVRFSPLRDISALALIALATKFFKENAIQWIEVMSLENQLESVVHSIHHLFDFLRLLNVFTSDLYHLAENHLRFTRSFFPLIQQSALHIYHSALPLSPKSSMFHSTTLQKEASIMGFHGRPETWGPVIQTIHSGFFSNSATFGHWIAVAQDCEVMICDAITGASRLSLRLENYICAVGGSPDGSILFCGHKNGSVTSWDIQTGGLVHTFSLENEDPVKKISISRDGRFLACGSSDSLVHVLKVTNEGQLTGIWESSSAKEFCWLGLDKHLAIARGVLVQICDIVAGTTLHSLLMADSISAMVYSQDFNELAASLSGFRSTMVIIKPQTGTSTVLFWSLGEWSHFAFSPANEIVCGMKDGRLGVYSISKKCWRHIKHPHTVDFISTLPNKTIVVGSESSGIQLLSLDVRDAPSPQSTLAVAMTTFDQGRIIAVNPLNSDNIELLETSTMSNVFTKRLRYRKNPLNCFLSASLENRLVLCCFPDSQGKFCLELTRFKSHDEEWNVELESAPSAGRLSPAGTCLLTLTMHSESLSADIYMGGIQGHLNSRQRSELIDPTPPSSHLNQKHDSTPTTTTISSLTMLNSHLG
ncbi:hypothetical protein BJ322DRAFT_1108609 [Thelephora terrestris]|uniref:NACHT domain-containing protein n=1 Tax=Thelephora terrestris TaxID=56493 RepID=A0A9P6L725_9AGAM|nr:hypothetical protein BJ322DRAFT_1108609 [Thelephora terrestris]